MSYPTTNISMESRSVLFIDGNSLIKTMEAMGAQLFGPEMPAINWDTIVQGYDRVFYYDALPSRKNGETEGEYNVRWDSKKSQHDALSKIENMHVKEGLAKSRRGKVTQQKGVDILLAVDAFQQATLGNMDRAVFLLSDLDFYPLFEAMLQTRCRTELFFDPLATATELATCVDKATPIDGQLAFKWFKCNEVENFRRYTPVMTKRVAGGFEVQRIETEGITYVVYHIPNQMIYRVKARGQEYGCECSGVFMALQSLELRNNHKLGSLTRQSTVPKIAPSERIDSVP